MKWVICTFLCLLSVPLSASLKVRISDPNTLESIDLPEVMVGSRVSLVVHSDANDFRSGGLFIKGQDRALGQLQARFQNPDPNSRDWLGSHLPAAGPGAHVLGWKDSLMWGYDFYPDDFDFQREPGKWFVIDYYALEEGLCDIGYYDHGYSWTEPDPNRPSLFFVNTPTRDLYPDGYVNFADFAIFSTYWQAENCGDPNSACYQADFDRNGSVGLEDVVMFANFWLHGNPGWKPAQEITQPESDEIDPNNVSDIIYAIVDANSMSEITLQVGESIELYVVQSSVVDETYIFYAEVDISDPNLGWIDNTSGTAQIWATPRLEYVDYISPGTTQPQGIEFFALNIGSMLDGDMASFIYTAEEVGDVTLNLIDYAACAGQFESITIHQVIPLIEQLQQIYEESPELQAEMPEPEWNEFLQAVEESEQDQ